MLVTISGKADMRIAATALALFAISCCEQAPPPEPEIFASPHPPGTTLHYRRSNQDDTNPEDIYVHIVSPTELAVMKRRASCTDAALVTATFDAETGEALSMIGGRLGKDTRQVPQAFLAFDPDARTLTVRFGDPDKSKPDFVEDAPAAPWRMYDFDLAEFALFGPRGDAAQRDFAFGLAMTWPADDAPPFQVFDGPETARFDKHQESQGGPGWNIYSVSGGGIDGGELWLDAAHGSVVLAEFSRPNHPGYDDFKLQLRTISSGEDNWTRLLHSHWADCPTNPAEAAP